MNKIISILIILLTIVTASISTMVTIIPIAMEFKGQARNVATCMFAILQVTMFLIALVKFNVKKYTPQHYIFIIRVQRLLLVISILGTMSFFNMSRSHLVENQATVKSLLNIVPFIASAPFYDWLVDNTVYFGYIALICFLLDVVSLKMPTVAYDLYFNLRDEAKIDTFWSKIWAILTHGLVTRVDNRFKEISEEVEVIPEVPEVIPEVPEVIPEVPEVIPEEAEVIPEGPKEIEVIQNEPSNDALPIPQIEMVILNGPSIVDSGSIKEKYGLSKNQWAKITKDLQARKIIEKSGTKFKRAI